MTNTIQINGTEYKIKYTLRALFLFEEISKKQFKIETLLDNYLFFYCMILANNADTPLTWDEFINALDDDPTLFVKMNEIVSKMSKIDDVINGKSEDGEQKKS